MSRNKLYVLLSTACIAGYIWLAINYRQQVAQSQAPGICIVKRLTGVPCPSCGTTRSVMAIAKGDLGEGIYWNPFGFLITGILIVSPLWIAGDLLSRKASLLKVYLKAEDLLKQKRIAIPLILMVILNWIWNIAKGL